MSDKKNYTIKDKKTENGELLIVVVIPKDFVEDFKDKAIKSIGSDLEIKGFRKGMAPKNIVIEKVGAMAVLQEQAYLSLNQILPEIIITEKIKSIANPKVEITKISPSDDLEFKAVFILMPEVKLPDYKKITKSIKEDNKPTVEEKEINDYIDYIRKQRAEAIYLHKKTNGEKVEEGGKEKLPEFNDEFVKTLGNFKDVADFKKQLKDNMLQDKEIRAQQSRRMRIIESIIEQTEVTIPDILIEEEIDRMLNNFKSQIESMKINFESYLKEIKKTEDDLRKDWKADATKRVKIDLTLPQIAKAENLKPDQEKIEHELKHIKEHHKEVNVDYAKIYITHQLTNDKVFEFLENLK